MSALNIDIVVILPCYNEETTIGRTVQEFRKYLPDARIFVFNNNSTDNTAYEAFKAGAEVVKSPKQGKGAVMRHALSVLDADIYLFADGDFTYPATYAPMLCETAERHQAMVIGNRLYRDFTKAEHRLFHDFGNRLVRFLVNFRWHSVCEVEDIMTGYRAIPRRMAKYFAENLTTDGFEVETEMTILALRKNLPVISLPTRYRGRPKNSVSKLHTISDGMKILCLIARYAVKK